MTVPEPVVAKLAKTPKQLQAKREWITAARIRSRADGLKRVEVYLPGITVEQVDAIKAQHCFRNRSQAIEYLLDRLLANPDIIKEFGL